MGGDGWWRGKIYQHRTYYWDWSLKWVNANEFRAYFKGKSACSEVGKYSWGDWPGFATPTNYTPMIRGDIVSINFDYDDDRITDHTEIGVGVGQSIYTSRGVFNGDLIDQHSSERHYAIWHMKDRKPVKDMQNYVFRIWHLTNDFTND